LAYHGPGQLVGYPILDLNRRGRDLHRYLRALEELLIEALAAHGVEGSRREGLTGVWVGPRKIASIGVGVRRWVSMHGFALNVVGGAALAPFGAITPCGIADVQMTAVESETGQPLGVETFAQTVADVFTRRLDELLPRDDQ
jgi:lipoyl(octanoyl) transferase